MLGTGVVVAAIVWGNATVASGPEYDLGGRINAEHKRVCGGASLSNDARLIWSARYRSSDMVMNGYFAHVNPWTGRRVWDLYKRVGIGYSFAGEIIAWNSYSDDQSALGAYNQFMGSTSHRAVIRDCHYTRIGVGAYKAGTKRMFTVEFIRP
jgi:uncharacterized protein YkwD